MYHSLPRHSRPLELWPPKLERTRQLKDISWQETYERLCNGYSWGDSCVYRYGYCGSGSSSSELVNLNGCVRPGPISRLSEHQARTVPFLENTLKSRRIRSSRTAQRSSFSRRLERKVGKYRQNYLFLPYFSLNGPNNQSPYLYSSFTQPFQAPLELKRLTQ